MLLQFLVMMYAVATTFVLASAERNRREMRMHGPALEKAGHLALSASLAFAILFGVWAVLYASGYVTVLPAI